LSSNEQKANKTSIKNRSPNRQQIGFARVTIEIARITFLPNTACVSGRRQFYLSKIAD
jgi:hypothetical protein